MLSKKILGKSFIVLLPFLFVFISSLFMPQDPDLGWHLKYGEYFFKNGQILKENTFSTMMPDFIWPNASWGADLIYYSAYHLLGFLGLSILGAIVVTLTFIFFSMAFNITFWQKALIFPILIILEYPINEVSFRGQSLSIMFLGVLFYLITRYENFKSKKIYLIPLLFLFWGNIHGQFILGLGVFFIWVLVYLLKQFFENGKHLLSIMKEVRLFTILIFLTLSATLIHPFGIGIYEDALLHFNNPLLKYVAEYLPFSDTSQLWWNQIIIGILITFGVIFLQLSDNLKPNITYLGNISILYGMSFLVRRYAWSLYYLTIPFLKPVADYFKPDSQKAAQITATIIFIISISLSLLLNNPFSQISSFSWEKYCKMVVSCSPKSVEFLLNYKYDPNKFFSFYDWGGFLIWNYPTIKPLIDGRMHLWEDKKGYSGFKDYYGYEQNFKDIDKSRYTTVLISPKKPLYKRLEVLVNERKWKLVFKDEFAGVFVRILK